MESEIYDQDSTKLKLQWQNASYNDEFGILRTAWRIST